MPVFKRIFLFIISLLLSVSLHAQYVNYGTDPATFKWETLQTPHYKLIFPATNDSMAYRYAHFLETAYPYIGKTIGASGVKGFPVILHPGNMLSNGLVAWAPRRMELITTPPPDQYAQSWDRQLVLHESRHVLQMQKLSEGIFKPLYYILGEQTSGIAGFAVPKWFFEGDAVATETALSSTGRGRLPEFNLAYRAQMLSDDFYSYDKWALGSYEDYTGDYYALGYDLTSFARYKYGADIWDKVTSRYTRRILAIPPFSNGLKHYTGINTSTLFKQTFAFLNEEWKVQDSIHRQSGFADRINLISRVTRKYASYNYPQEMEDSSVIAVKTSLEDLNSLVKIKNGREERLSYTGNINSRILLNNNRIYWTEYVAGIRWIHENYSDLKYYDLNTKRIHSLASHRRYLAPAVRGDGKIVAVSEISGSGNSRIVLLDSGTGESRATFDAPFHAFIKDLTFDNTGNLIAVTVDDEGIRLFRIDVASGQWDELMAPTSANITSLTWKNDRLFFESGLNGTNNIYSLDMQTLQCFRLTNARFGAFSPAFSSDGNRLLFSDYQSDGNRIVSVVSDSLKPESADFDRPHRFTLAETIAAQEQFNLDTAVRVPIDPSTKPYRKAMHLFNFHSWAPFYFDAVDAVNVSADDLTTTVKPGVMALSQNALNTAISQIGWYYDLDGGYGHGKLAFTYMGWYPVIDLSVDYGGKAFDIGWEKDNNNNDALVSYNLSRSLLEADVRLYIPFNFTKNHYLTGFQPSLTYRYTNNRYQQYDSRKFCDFQYLLGEIWYYHYRKLSKRDILPRWGYQVRLQYLNDPVDSENFGSLYAARLTTYFPGIVRNHGWMVRLAYQYQDLEGKTFYMPKQLIDPPRGYAYSYQTRQQTAIKADYSFGLFYPDYSLGALAYIKRIRSNVFYDISFNQRNERSGWTTQSSYGADLIFDCNLFRLSYPLSLGIRMIKPLECSNLQAEALFSVSF